jgi:phage tail tape-measure protein
MSFSDDPRRAAMPRPKDRVLSTETVGDPEADDPEAAGQEGAAAGAVLGTVIAGPIGAVAGAAIGGAAGATGETVDDPADERRHDAHASHRDESVAADQEVDR